MLQAQLQQVAMMARASTRLNQQLMAEVELLRHVWQLHLRVSLKCSIQLMVGHAPAEICSFC